MPATSPRAAAASKAAALAVIAGAIKEAQVRMGSAIGRWCGMQALQLPGHVLWLCLLRVVSSSQCDGVEVDLECCPSCSAL